MANKWLNYIFQTDYRGSERNAAIALADAVNDSGRVSMRIGTLATKANISIRQAQRVVRNLEIDGLVTFDRVPVKGSTSTFQLNRVTTATPYKDRLEAKKGDNRDVNKGDSVTPKTENRVTNEANKGDNCDTNRVTNEAPSYCKEEPYNEPQINPKREREDPPANPQPAASDFGPRQNIPSDPNFFHPAIKHLREMTNHDPPKEAKPLLIAVLGTDFDVGRLAECYARWRAKGARAANFDFVLDWYVNGIPEKWNGKSNGYNKQNERSNADVVRASAEFFKKKFDHPGG